jgi:hypothetical protein
MLYLVSHAKGKRQLRGFENRVPRKIFTPNKDEVTGVWRKLFTEGSPQFVLFTKCYLDDQFEEDQMDGVCSAHPNDEQYVQFLK